MATALIEFRGGPFDGEQRDVPQDAWWPIEAWWTSDDVLVPRRLAGVYLAPAAPGLPARYVAYVEDGQDPVPPPWFPSH